MWDLQQHNTACDRWKTQQRQNRTLHLPSCGQPGTAHGGNELNGAKGDVEENGIQVTEPKGFDDQRTKCSNAAAWDTMPLLVIGSLMKLTILTRWKPSMQTTTRTSGPDTLP